MAARKMKKLLVVLTLLGSISAFAGNNYWTCTAKCTVLAPTDDYEGRAVSIPDGTGTDRSKAIQSLVDQCKSVTEENTNQSMREQNQCGSLVKMNFFDCAKH